MRLANTPTGGIAMLIRALVMIPLKIGQYSLRMSESVWTRPIGIVVALLLQPIYMVFFAALKASEMAQISYFSKAKMLIYGFRSAKMIDVIIFAALAITIVMWAIDYYKSDDREWNYLRSLLIKLSFLAMIFIPVFGVVAMREELINGNQAALIKQAIIVIALVANFASSAAIPMLLIWVYKKRHYLIHSDFASRLFGKKIKRHHSRLFRTSQGTIHLEADRSLLGMPDWRAFEYAVAHLMKNEYGHAITTDELKQKKKLGFSYSGDQGSDVICDTSDGRVVVQCKYYSNPVGVKAVDETLRAQRVYGASKMVLVTNHTVTIQCRDAAKASGIRLITGHDLARLKSKIKLAA